MFLSVDCYSVVHVSTTAIEIKDNTVGLGGRVEDIETTTVALGNLIKGTKQ